jgi:hypothetical protein
MSRPPRPTVGSSLKVKERSIPFSFWPVGKTTRRYGLQSHLFITNPWTIIRRSIQSFTPATSKIAALSYLDQAEDFFRAAASGTTAAAKPLLFYYSLMNLVKAFCLHKGVRDDYSKARHGLSEQLGVGGREILDAYLDAYPSGGEVNVFDDFLVGIRGTGLSAKQQFPISHLLPQILQGHRLWCLAADEDERFFQIEKIHFRHEPTTKCIWIDWALLNEDLSRFDVSRKRVLSETGMDAHFKNVAFRISKRLKLKLKNASQIRFHQKNTITYTHRPSDIVQQAVNNIRPFLWTNVLIMPPYRKYYIYLCPSAEKKSLLPQLVSIFAVFYYFGSITRYRPYQFQAIADGDFGSQIQEVLTNLPNQFLYLIASEFAEQEVTRAAIV